MLVYPRDVVVADGDGGLEVPGSRLWGVGKLARAINTEDYMSSEQVGQLTYQIKVWNSSIAANIYTLLSRG